MSVMAGRCKIFGHLFSLTDYREILIRYSRLAPISYHIVYAINCELKHFPAWADQSLAAGCFSKAILAIDCYRPIDKIYQRSNRSSG